MNVIFQEMYENINWYWIKCLWNWKKIIKCKNVYLVFNTLHVLQLFSSLSLADMYLQIRFWSFRSPFWHKSLVGAGPAAVCSHWLLSFWLTASWPVSEGISVAPSVWMWASLSSFLFHFNDIKLGVLFFNSICIYLLLLLCQHKLLGAWEKKIIWRFNC